MPRADYSVDFTDGVWKVGVNGDRFFGPYSSLDAAMTAASGAAHKAEALGYEVFLTVNGPAEVAEAEPAAEERNRDAA